MLSSEILNMLKKKKKKKKKKKSLLHSKIHKIQHHYMFDCKLLYDDMLSSHIL